jgi:GT2 family glycosyltransferase
MSNKIGIGIITCNRPDFANKCVLALHANNEKEYFHEAILVNDGKEITEYDLSFVPTFNNKTNIGVGRSKNKAFKYLLDKGCDHIFLIEDDIIVKDLNVFQAYIDARNKTGIQHFNFGYHGPANKAGISGGKPSPRYVIDYGDIKIAINQHSVGAFCYYTREVLEKVGLIDENFHNAFEHVEHDYRIAKAGFCTPYWNWPDLANSIDYLDEIECSEKSSSIRPRKDWQENIQKGAMLFQQKHGVLPAWQNAVPDSTLDQVKSILKSIHKTHSITNA